MTPPRHTCPENAPPGTARELARQHYEAVGEWRELYDRFVPPSDEYIDAVLAARRKAKEEQS